VNKKINSDKLFKTIDYGVRLGAARALAEHKRDGRPIVISRNGKIVHIPPEEIEIPEEFKDIV
jgi:imidazolonepropionase-like amidohydrolase